MIEHKEQETESVLARVDNISGNLSDKEKNTIRISWRYFLENSTYIPEDELVLEVKDRSFVEKRLKEYPKILHERNWAPKISKNHIHIHVVPSLLGVLSIDTKAIWKCLEILVKEAAWSYGESRDSNLIESAYILSKYSEYPKDTICLIKHIAELIPSWSMREDESTGEWKIWYDKNIVDVTVETHTVEEYIERCLEPEFSKKSSDQIVYELLGHDIPTTDFLLWRSLMNTISKADELVRCYTPQFVDKMIAIQDNLLSNNPEHWANAVNSMRRVFEKLADNLYPPLDEGVVIRGNKEIKVGKKNYANRITCFLEENIKSRKELGIANANTNYLQMQRKRLDAILAASNKGTHEDINTREEAELYVLHGYLLIRDILNALDKKTYDQ